MTALTPPQRILIVRLTALGDVIHGLPVLCALREAFPRAHLAWVVEGRCSTVIEDHPDLDEVIAAPRRWYRSAHQIGRLRHRLQAGRFDTTVDLQCLTKSAVLAWLSGAKQRLGVAGKDGREFSKWFNNSLTALDAPHVIEHYLRILRPLGIETPAVRFGLKDTQADAHYADERLISLGLTSGRFVVVNPGAGWPSKLWPTERYGELAARIYSERGIQCLAVWGTPDEKSMAQQIVQASQGTALLASATTIRQLAAICRRATLFVGSDTGPMHLAVAVGTPTISLHGPSRSAWCGAYGENNVAIQAWYEEGSSQHRRNADNRAMRAITVDRVIEACNRLFRPSTLRHAAG